MSEKDIEVLEPEIETAPEASGLVAESQGSIDSMLLLADNIDRLIEAQNKIRAAVMKLAQPGDWVKFGDGDTQKAEIGFAGAMRIGSTLGVNFTNWEARKESGRDESGEWYRWEYECDASYRGRIIRVYGRAGSRDKFFGKVRGEFKPLHEVDEGNIKIAGRRAAMKEGVKVLFGLHHMDPNFVSKYGISLASAGGHSFKSVEQKASESNVTSVQIESVMKREGTTNGRKWEMFIIKDAEGVEYKTFSKEIAEISKALIGKSASIQFSKNDKGITLDSIEPAAETK